MRILYAFTFDTETQEATRTGNVSTANAVQILQQIAIAEAIEFGRKANGVPRPEADELGSGDPSIRGNGDAATEPVL